MASDIFRGLLALGAGAAESYVDKKTAERQNLAKQQQEALRAEARQNLAELRGQFDRYKQEQALAQRASEYERTQQFREAMGYMAAQDRDLSRTMAHEDRMAGLANTAAIAAAGRENTMAIAKMYEAGRGRRFMDLYGPVDPATGRVAPRTGGSAAAPGKLSTNMTILKSIVTKEGEMDPAISKFFDDVQNDPKLEGEVWARADQAADELEAAGEPRPDVMDADFMRQVINYVKTKRQKNRQQFNTGNTVNQSLYLYHLMNP